MRLVAWRYADRDEDPSPESVVGWDGDRAVVREVLDRVGSDDTICVVGAGPVRALVPAGPTGPEET